jgi:hypothetical protein
MAKKRTEAEWEEWCFEYESKLQAYVLKRLSKCTGLVVTKVLRANRNGVSDLLVCMRGMFVAIELKVKNKEPTKLQAAFIDEVNAVGGVAGVAWCWGDVKRILRAAGYDGEFPEE